VVLFKDGRLDDEEYKIIQTHALHTLNILDKIHFTRDFKGIPMMAATHHERIDGTGYPLGLRGEDIPEEGRVMAVADIFDAITSRRHYRDRMNFGKVLRVLDEEAEGGHIQHDFLAAFKALPLTRIVAILESDNTDTVPAEDMEKFGDYTLGYLQDVLEKDDSERSAEEKDLVVHFGCCYDRAAPTHGELD